MPTDSTWPFDADDELCAANLSKKSLRPKYKAAIDEARAQAAARPAGE